MASIVEENTVKFYHLCHTYITSQKAKKELLAIIVEEQKHQKLFESLLVKQK